jgi:tetratricopeptide (TPR) repeat protein
MFRRTTTRRVPGGFDVQGRTNPGRAGFAFGQGFVLLTLSLAACTPAQTARVLKTAPAFPQPVEITATPFHPQEEYQCGPAALATLLNHSGVEVTPEALTEQVYLPAREGSLQLELLAAARRQGRVPYVLRPQFESLLAEVASGNPVLVFQNLGVSWYPVWHYAVVVGFDLASDDIVMRSGTDPRRVISLSRFEHTWARSNYWAVVITPPGKLPATAEEIPYLQSVTALERLSFWEETEQAYAAAAKRWPKSLPAWLGLGNSRYALNNLTGAEAAFRRAVELHADSAAALNNLAQVLLELNQPCAARRYARRAVELGGAQRAVYEQTLSAIEQRLDATAAK